MLNDERSPLRWWGEDQLAARGRARTRGDRVDRRLPLVATCAWVSVLLASLPARADGPLVPKAQLQKLEAIVKEVAAKGRDAEMNDLLDVLRRMGEDAAVLAKLRVDASKALRAVKTPARDASLVGIAHGLHSIAGDLAKDLGRLDDTPRGTLSELILRLDDDQPAAHKMLGHLNEDGKWTSEESKRLKAKRAAIQAAIVQARGLEVPLTSEPVAFAPLAAIDPAPANSVRFGKLELVSTWELPRLERLMRGVLRAAALSEFLCGRPLKVPAAIANSREKYLLLFEKEKYLKAIDLSAAAKTMRPEDVGPAREWGGYYDARGFYVAYDVGEVGASAGLTQLIAETWLVPGVQPCLERGHVNWLCLTCFGSSAPGVVADRREAGADAHRTSDRPRDTPEEKLAKALESAGISGARRWLIFKAAHGEDPAWANSFVDEKAKIHDLDLLKCTFVAEFLQEHERLDTLMRKTSMRETDKTPREEVISKQVVEGLPAFEGRFHEWLLPYGGAIAQRLLRAAQPPDKLSKDEAAAVADLDRVRRQAWVEESFGPYAPVEFDRELSNSCALHVAYLKLHRAQLEKWPDAHEEYPDQEGFSAEGCWAGTHSVIAPGVTRPEEAIAGWMGTYYHRLPLLDPGLKRFGFAMGDMVAVLDADSLVDPFVQEGLVLWPPPDMKGVPTHFEPELPNPVPGQDESQFGYPITLQAFHSERAFPSMKLVRGNKPDGAEVACWFSSPAKPTNLDCNPPGAWCLIPKSPLDSGVKYTVVATGSDGKNVVWTFATGQ
jgi:hypothetical protein